jgi:hypothetical protein
MEVENYYLKTRSVTHVTLILLVLLLSTIILLYIFEFGIVHAQNYDQDNNDHNDVIDDTFDYIFDPGNYVEFEEEEEEKKEKVVVVRNDNSDNIENQNQKNNLGRSSSSITTKTLGKEEKKIVNNTNMIDKKNSESKLKIIDNDVNNKNTESLGYVSNNDKKNYNLNDKAVVKTRLNLANLKKEGYLNVVGFINGQEVLKNVSLNTIDSTKKTLTVNLAVDKETDIVQAGSRDEFFVCAYHIKDLYKKKVSNDALTYFDCDEGDLAGSGESTISRLFSASSQVYQKSQNIFANSSSSKYSQLITANKNINNDISKNLQDNIDEEKQQQDTVVKIKVFAPLEDRKNIQKLKIIAMVKGQIKSAVIDNVQEEFEKIGGYKVSRTFTFDRDTNMGKIQIGDRFHACVSSNDLNPPEGTECEKRTIKYIGEKENILYAR